MGFDTALAFTLKEEGGYGDHPLDAGGATNRGVTQAVYDEWRKSQGAAPQEVQQITDEETGDLYWARYWEPGRCGELAPALGVVHFDWCVNHGVQGAAATLQQAAGSVPRYEALRRQWYVQRVAAKPDQAKFLKGWLARVDRLDQYVGGLK